MIRSVKNYRKKKQKTKKKRTDRTIGQMVKAKLYRQNHTQKHTHIPSQKEKKEKNIYIIAPKVHHLNLLWFIVYSGIPQMQGTSSWLWRFNPLLLRLHGEISLSPLCLHSSWFQQWIWPCLCMWVTWEVLFPLREDGFKVAGDSGALAHSGHEGREGYRCGASLQRQRPVWCCTSLRLTMRSPGEVAPASRDPGSGGLQRLLGWEVWIVTCACTQASWWLQ